MMKNIKTTAIVLSLWTLTLSSCYSAMPISNARTEKADKTDCKTVIVYYDSSIGTDAIEKFIKKNAIEVLYRYNNIHGYALKLKSDKQCVALEKTKGVLSVQDDKVIQFD
jgi:spermidine/putrescine-binding protein